VNNRLIIKATMIAVITLLLTACGYQLQKPIILDDNTQPVYVDGDRLISIALKQQLRSNSIAIVSNASSAKSIITVALIDNDSRSYSVSADARDAESLRSMAASIEWHRIAASENIERTLIQKTVVNAEVVQTQNPDNVAAQNSEGEILIRELRERLVEKMISLIRYH
jgi:outer membrane lipopolysaccharide assembly protein LptE/RlpB